jgi:hypothetical protein
MNVFYERHKSSIEFVYRCFDRILLNGLIQPLPTTGASTGVLQYLSGWETGNPSDPHRDCRPVPHWVINRAERWRAPIVGSPAAGATRRFCAVVLAKE